MLASIQFRIFRPSVPSKNIQNKNIQVFILLPVLYECETWSVTLSNEHKMFQGRVLRRIFGPKKEEVGGGWRRLRNEELHNL
jgi:hypothetical protein